MIILCDTRQQAHRHDTKNKWFIANGITVNRVTLTCGDYQIAGKSEVAVDSKFSIMELIGDVQCKVMSKKDVKDACGKLLLTKFRPGARFPMKVEEIYHIITDDDSERFPESEITKWCFETGCEDLTEKFKDLYVKRHGFFHRGLIRAKSYGVKLYILVENEDGVTDINSLFKWVNPRRKLMVNTSEVIGTWKNGKPRYKKVQKYPNCMMGQQLAKACLTMQKKYGCEFVFCTPEQAAEKIVELLNNG